MHYDDQRQFFEELARRYDSRFLRSRWPRNQRLKAEVLRKLLGEALERGPVLELGCGTAQIAAELLESNPELEYVGLDLSRSMLDVARHRLERFAERVELREAANGSVELEPGLYRAAFGVDVLHHVDDPVEVLRDLSAAVRPGGVVAFLEPNPRFPITTMLGLLQKEERKVLQIGFRNLHTWFSAAGLTAVDVSYGPMYTPPGPDSVAPLLDLVDASLARVPVVRGLAIFFVARGEVAA